MRNSFTRVQIFEPISLELRVTCVTDVTRAFDVWVYLYLSCDRADPECVGALVTAEVAVRAHATFPPLQLFAPHTLTHSSCDVKGVRAQKREMRARNQRSAIKSLHHTALRAGVRAPEACSA